MVSLGGGYNRIWGLMVKISRFSLLEDLREAIVTSRKRYFEKACSKLLQTVSKENEFLFKIAEG